MTVYLLSEHKIYESYWTNGGISKTKWASIETSVGEFTAERETLEYFERQYLPFADEIERRLLFVRVVNGEAVGTMIRWWNHTGERRDPSIHWLAIRNEYQGLGLGKALVSGCLKRLTFLESEKDVWLHTQTWSHKAIGLYIKAGFEPVQQEPFSQYANDYEHAIPILRQTLPSLLR